MPVDRRPDRRTVSTQYAVRSTQHAAFFYIERVKPRTTFLLGGVLVLGTAGYLMASSIKDTAVFYLTPQELHANTVSDPTFYETGVKVGARVVPGTIVREPGGRAMTFDVTDGARTYKVA